MPARDLDLTFGQGEPVSKQPVVQQPPEKKGFFSRVFSDIKKRSDDFVSGAISRDQTSIEDLLQLGGTVAGGLFDIGGEVLVTAGRAVGAITPEKIKKPVTRFAKDKLKAILDTPEGQAGLNAINTGVEVWEEYKETNPRAAANIESVVNVGLLFPTTAVVRAGVGKVAPAVGEVAGKAAVGVEKRLAKQKIDEALEVTRVRVGELTAREKKELLRTGKTETKTALGGLSRKEVITITEKDREVAGAVSDVVSTAKGASENIKAIRDKIASAGKDIDVSLKGNNTIYNTSQLRSLLKEGREGSISIFGREKTLVDQYDDVIDFFMKTLEKHPKNNTGLLAARKEFDNEFDRRFKGIFDKFNSTDSGRVAAFRDIRTKANDIIADSLPEGHPFIPLKEQQHLMFDAIDNIALKGGKNLETGLIERSLQAIDAHGIRTLVISGSLLGFSALTSPPFIISLLAGGATIKIGKKVFKAKVVKEAIIKALRKVEKESKTLSASERKEISATISLLGGTGFVKSAVQLPEKEVEGKTED